MRKVRLDVLLVERNLAESRSQAQRMVMAGQVRVEGQLVIKPATAIVPGAKIQIETAPRFVSRGGEKLAAALEAFKIVVTGCICADVGASTGGFTDCLLQNGAARVYAIDVGKGLLHWKLRNDPRVVVMEGTNARYVASLPEPVSLVTVDAAFISLRTLLPVVKNWLSRVPDSQLHAKKGKGCNSGEVIALVKPQFEAGRIEVARGEGVIRDPEIHRQVLLEVLAYAQDQGLRVSGLIRSPVLGPKGNTEFLAWVSLVGVKAENLTDLVTGVLNI